MNNIYEKLCLIFQIILFFIFKIKTKKFQIFVKLTDLWEYVHSPATCNTKNFTYITLCFMKFISFLWLLGPLLMSITYHLCSCLLPLWCSNLATKLHILFPPNMPWFLHTCTSLPIPVTLPGAPSLFASGKCFFALGPTQRSHLLWSCSLCSDQIDASALPQHFVHAPLCSHPFLLWLSISMFVTFSWLRAS